MKYLSFWVICDGVKSLIKIRSNKNMKPSTSQK